MGLTGIGVALVLAAGPAHAEPDIIAPPLPVALVPWTPAPPPLRWEAPRDSGLWWILGGTGLLAGGAGNLLTAPICNDSRIADRARPACWGLSIGFGLGLLAAGIPLVVVGARHRAGWMAWKSRLEGRW